MSSERVPREVIDLWWDLCRDKLGAGKKKDICSFLVTRHRSNPELTSVLPGDIVRAVWDKNYSGNEGTQAFRTTKTQLREKLLDIYRMDDEGRIPVLDINAGNVFSFMVPRLVDRISRGCTPERDGAKRSRSSGTTRQEESGHFVRIPHIRVVRMIRLLSC
jgi:hypothetical protein